MAAQITPSEFARFREILEVLAGMRGDPRKFALRAGTVADLQELIGGLKLSATSLSASLGKISDAVAAAEGSIVGTQENISALQGHVGQLDNSIAGLSGQLQTAMQQLASLNGELDEAERRIGGVAQQASDTASQLAQVRREAGGVTVPTQQSGEVSGAPTASDFNRLVADVGAVLTALQQLKTAVD
ncbi:hypothetical protein PEp14_00022 [Erwinia phage PEp14]|uniref:Uncharacterized protein n=1 Tax=Erwinia phage PEp14 TaxID=1131315 RepID=H2DE52_9CAUD|nr:virion structural protein [Erwinia phage PEp14]AEY69611.1 hypothetical protein PEp14_00022 [Erwinia phage PEp14]